MKKIAPPPEKARRRFPKYLIITLAAVLLAALAFSLVFFFLRADVMVIGGERVPYDMVANAVKTRTAGMTEEELADEATREALRKEVIDALCKTYAPKIVADEFGVKLSATQKAALKEEIRQAEALPGFEEFLRSIYATKSVYEDLAELAYYDNALYAYLTEYDMGGRFASDNLTIDKDLAAGDWYAVEYAILVYQDGNFEERKERMETAREAAAGGTSFALAVEPLRKEFDSDFFYETDGCFTSTIYSEKFEALVKSLAIHEVSAVEDSFTSDGQPCLLLVKRLPVEDDYVDNNYNTIIAYYLQREYYEYMIERSEALSVEMTEYYRDFDILDIE